MICEIIKALLFFSLGVIVTEHIMSKDSIDFFDTGYEIGYAKGTEEGESRRSVKKNPKITQCEGEGQGSCKRCTDKGIWNREWMCFLYKIEGMDGCYCYDCVKEIVEDGHDGE